MTKPTRYQGQTVKQGRPALSERDAYFYEFGLYNVGSVAEAHAILDDARIIERAEIDRSNGEESDTQARKARLAKARINDGLMQGWALEYGNDLRLGWTIRLRATVAPKAVITIPTGKRIK